LLAVWQKLEPT